MQLKNLTDKELLLGCKNVAGDERSALIQVLRHLREVEARRLFCDLKYTSLRAFVINYMKYSEDAADRRIAAMRLTREFPEVEAKILVGTLNLTNITLVRALFRKEKEAGKNYSHEEKKDILKKFEDVSIRTARKIAEQINPDMKKREFTFDEIDDEVLREKLLRLKGQRAHKDPHLSLYGLLHELADMALDAAQPVSKRDDTKPQSKAETSRKIHARDKGKCENCGSHFMPEEDHIIPAGDGGDYSYENIRLLCKNCNLREAIKYYGRKKMDDYLGDEHVPSG